MKISVIIPIKNEPLINDLIKEIHEQLKDHSHEIIVIDKSDDSSKIVDAKHIIQKSNGLGNAVLEGLNYTTGDTIVIMDGDFSHDPRDIMKLIKGFDTADIVIGSKFSKGGKSEDDIHRRIISKIYNWLACSILNLNVEDPMSGFSAIKRFVFDSIKLSPLGYKINMEILYKSRNLGYSIMEVPIIFHQRKAGKTKAGLREGFRTIRFMIDLKLGLR